MTPTMSPRAADEADVPVIEMVRPMPGFPEQRRFALVRLDEAGDLCSLTSLDDPELRFLVVPPTRFFPDYAPEVAEDVVADLEIGSPEDVLLLVVLKAGTSLASTTANLAAPVLVNPATRRAGQIVLDEPGLPLAAPLIA
ncbi:flagellar assembly protein FliW [Nocardioides pyridinolyticus]